MSEIPKKVFPKPKPIEAWVPLAERPYKTREGLLRDQTVRALVRADRLLLEAHRALEDAALMVSEDVTDHNEQAMNHAGVHPLHDLLWRLVGDIEDGGFELQKCIKLERSKG